MPPLAPNKSRNPAPLPMQAPQIVLTWLVRLRWLAAAGQLAAIIAAAAALDLRLPIAAMAAVLGATVLTNAVLAGWIRRASELPRGIVPAVLLLDIALLTALLYLSGGPANPFATLYLVHVAMAVVASRRAWTWIIVAAAAGSYALLFAWHLPLSGGPLPQWAIDAGNWISLALVASLIAYFTGRVTRALRRRERELVDARERARQNEQLAALATLAAGAAHELNTPLGTIAVAARELERASAACDPAIGDDARLIRREVDRCRAIINRMRVEVAGDSAARPAEIAPQRLIDDARAALGESERPRLIAQCASELPLHLPVLPMQQALSVLLRNAFDASSPDAPVTLAIHPDAAAVRFTVTDHGCGMDGEVLRRASEPFFTTKPPGRGMGLGLFLARLVAERCGGALRIESTPGHGTRAILEIPTNCPVKQSPREDKVMT